MSVRPAHGPDPVTPLWLAAVLLRVFTLAFAGFAVLSNRSEYARPGLALVVLALMVAWTGLSTVDYVREHWRHGWAVVLDVLVTCGLMLTSPLVLSQSQYDASDPLITTVWAAVPPVAAGARFGAGGGVLGGLVVAVSTGLARQELNLDVVRDGVLLIATGLLIGMSASTARRSAAALAKALRKEAATAERERLARSIHDSVLQVLARVRKRGLERGGEAAELAMLAGEQEIALRALVTTEPVRPAEDDVTDLRSALQLLATSRVQVSAPAGLVELPSEATTELVAATREALSNVEKHAGPEAKAWVLLEDLGGEVVLTIRDDGAGIAAGELERARQRGHFGVAKSIRGRIEDLGGRVTLETAPGVGTEWEFRVPVRSRGER